MSNGTDVQDYEDMSVSKRERIMRYVHAKFCGIEAGVNGFTQTWDVVSRKPLTKQEASLGAAIALFDNRESGDVRLSGSVSGGVRDQTLTITAEFYWKMRVDDQPGTELNRLLLDVQRAFLGDTALGGLTINVVEGRNELDVDGPADQLVQGMAEFSVLYRRRISDPRQ